MRLDTGTLHILVLVLAVFLLYTISLDNPIVFDSQAYLQAITSRILNDTAPHSPRRWLSKLTFLWTYSIFGGDIFWHRLINVSIHLLTSIAVYVFCRRLFGLILGRETPGAAVEQSWLALFAALIFALHPVAVYATAYLAQRSIQMATLFGIVSLLAFIEGVSRGKATWLALSAVLYALALYSKENVALLPAVAVALAVLLRGPSRALVRELWWVFGLYAAALASVWLAVGASTLIGTISEPFATEILGQSAASALPEDPRELYPLSVVTQGHLYLRYIGLLLVPSPAWMSIDVRLRLAGSILSWPETVGFVAYCLYGAAAVWLLLRRGRPGLLGFGLLYPWLLFPVEFSTIRLQEVFVLYRSYLWMSGAVLLLPIVMPRLDRVRIPILCVYCAILGYAALDRLATFESELALWNDAIAKTEARAGPAPGAYRAYFNRANAYRELGLIEEAVRDYTDALELDPDLTIGYANRGLSHLSLGEHDAAQKDFDAAIRRAPDDASLYSNRAILFEAMGRPGDALRDLSKAIALAPEVAIYYFNRAGRYASLGRFDDAIRDYNSAIARQPKLGMAHFDRGRVLELIGEVDLARRSFAVSCGLGVTQACRE